ncbi:transglutaminase domain-containing protein [Altericista sp. CCNU0014]|uniref:transglutaminase domain-containing protein n=1 Tax=Altericista sp. CCNU0014 TaxID=3082949 RepID=UPI00384EDF89
MRLHAGCKFSFETDRPTAATFMLRPRSGDGQWIVSEEYITEPSIPVTEYTDIYGNLCQRLVVPEGNFSLHTSVMAEAADEIDTAFEAPFIPVEALPSDVLQFLLPSRYCQSDRTGVLAGQVVEGVPLGYAQVEAIRNWIFNNVEYCYGTSDASTSAVETAETRIGVCRDFTHLGIALCRSLNIPARMVVGYLYDLKPMDLHAWFEAFVGDRWYTFDATQGQPKGNRIALAYGRDATDVAFVTQFGVLNLLEMDVWVDLAS